MTERVLFVDLGYTLVNINNVFSDADIIPGVTVYERWGQRFQVIPRPSAVAFLERFKSMGVPVSVVSGTATRMAMFVLRVAKLDELVDEVMGYGDWQLAGERTRWVLVDDLHSTDSAVADKLDRLGGMNHAEMKKAPWETFVRSHFVQCMTFNGAGDEPALTAVIPEVMFKLGITA